MSRLPAFAGAVMVAASLGVLLAGRTVAGAQGCTFTVNAPTLTFGNLQDGTAVTATPSAACTLTITSNDTWISAWGSTNGLVYIRINVQANTTGAVRRGTVLVNGQAAVAVTQGIEPCVTGFDPAVVRTTIDGAPRTAELKAAAPDCAWQVGGFPVWASFPSPTSGRGPAHLTFGFMGNTTGTGPRSTDLSYSGRTIRLEQDGPTCALTANPSSQRVPVNGGTFSFAITGVGTACDYVVKIFGNDITVVSGGAGTAPATLTLRLAPNPVPYERTSTIQVQNAFVSVTQDGSPISTDVFGTSFAYYLPSSGTSHMTAPSRVRVMNRTMPSALWRATTTTPWITLSPATGASPGTLTIGVDAAAAATLPDLYSSGVVDIRGDNAPDTPYTLRVDLLVRRTAVSRPFGVLETPRLGGPTVSGAIPVTGWATDDMGISRIALSRAAVAGEAAGEVYVGDAVRVAGARPDVGFGLPEGRLAGWGYMLLSNVLPNSGNGTFTLFADVTDVEGQTTRLGPRTVTIDNAHATRPFGTIDAPAQGATVSGTIRNIGWVLTPGGKAIPLDGSTIKVYIDGVLLAPVTSYNLPRPDVKAFFPGLANSDGPEGRLSIDTTTLADGVHTIAWGVIDDAGVAEGIGSRYFTVQNGAASQVLAAQETARSASSVQGLSVLKTDVWSRQGLDEGAWATRVEADESGARTLRAAQGERIELFLDPTLQAACGTYDGHLFTGAVAGPLPVGASLDAERGIFRWQPMPAFTGAFRFVFVQHGCDEVERRVLVTVVIAPR